VTWRAAFHCSVNPDALVEGYWMVTDGAHHITVPDQQAAEEVAAFYNRLIDLGYGIELLPRLLTPSWVET
jgi:hypothetical protein